MLATIPICNARNELKKMGFFHATGLPVFNAQYDNEYRTIQANYQELGSWGRNDHWVIVVLEDGEVWLRACKKEQQINRCIFRRLCRKGQTASVPLSHLDIIHFYFIALRLANPYDNCDGRASPVPQPR